VAVGGRGGGAEAGYVGKIRVVEQGGSLVLPKMKVTTKFGLAFWEHLSHPCFNWSYLDEIYLV